jgi:hypothetical protein
LVTFADGGSVRVVFAAVLIAGGGAVRFPSGRSAREIVVRGVAQQLAPPNFPHGNALERGPL